MVRAAIRQKDWSSVVAAVEAMPQELRETSGAWRYWKGRALKEQKQIPAANAILVPLSQERHYYACWPWKNWAMSLVRNMPFITRP